jgi:hypothetical protein
MGKAAASAAVAIAAAGVAAGNVAGTAPVRAARRGEGEAAAAVVTPTCHAVGTTGTGVAVSGDTAVATMGGGIRDMEARTIMEQNRRTTAVVAGNTAGTTAMYRRGEAVGGDRGERMGIRRQRSKETLNVC